MANFEIGMTAAEVVSEIVSSFTGIRGIELIPYIPQENLTVGTESVKEMLREGREFFPIFISSPAAKDAKYLTNKTFLPKERSLADPEPVLGIKSLLFNDSMGAYVKSHLPMMDFCCSKTGINLQRVKEGIGTVLESPWVGPEKGAILDSGRSYHYYGAFLLTTSEWLKFLARCLLLTGLTDPRYIGHSLLQGYRTLRLTANALRPKIPEVVEIV